jgi:hypothetical protein
MGAWEFEELLPSYVEQEPTQRDQFNNDDVSLADAVIREAIQNSMDAPADPAQPVKVRFELRDIPEKDQGRFLQLLEPLGPHLAACGLNSDLASMTPRVLLIEDFNTKGLTGNFSAQDDDNFHNFWRRHGKSVKTGKAGGRWGLGKLVYSSSSAIRAFFGLTIRQSDPEPALLGQCVLSSHVLNGKRYVAHGFWFEDRTADRIQLPLVGQERVGELAALFGFRRTVQPGLSLAIPYVGNNVTPKAIIRSVIENYYFPILAGHLEVEVGDTLIDAKTFEQIAAEAIGNDPAELAKFGFVKKVSTEIATPAKFANIRPVGQSGLGADCFSPETLTDMKAAFAAGKLVRVTVGVVLRPKDGPERPSHFDLLLAAVPENGKAFGLFVRGAITVPAEAKYFSGAHAMGALIARDDAAVTFLGDAENPAHTGWNGNAEKLGRNWKSPGTTLRAIRYALRALHDLVVDRVERRDTEALIDFFSLADAGASAKGPRKKNPIPGPLPPPAEKAFRITRPARGAFGIVAGPGAIKWTFPKTIRVKAAYDILRGNPFAKHNRFDFDLSADDIDFEIKGATLRAIAPNVIAVTVTEPDFSVEAKGFDENRDLVIEARAR